MMTKPLNPSNSHDRRELTTTISTEIYKDTRITVTHTRSSNEDEDSISSWDHHHHHGSFKGSSHSSSLVATSTQKRTELDGGLVMTELVEGNIFCGIEIAPSRSCAGTTDDVIVGSEKVFEEREECGGKYRHGSEEQRQGLQGESYLNGSLAAAPLGSSSRYVFCSSLPCQGEAEEMTADFHDAKENHQDQEDEVTRWRQENCACGDYVSEIPGQQDFPENERNKRTNFMEHQAIHPYHYPMTPRHSDGIFRNQFTMPNIALLSSTEEDTAFMSELMNEEGFYEAQQVVESALKGVHDDPKVIEELSSFLSFADDQETRQQEEQEQRLTTAAAWGCFSMHNAAVGLNTIPMADSDVWSDEEDSHMTGPQPQFFNTVANAVLAESDSDNDDDSLDQYADFTQTFEKQIAEEFLKTFGGKKSNLLGSASSSRDDGYATAANTLSSGDNDSNYCSEDDTNAGDDKQADESTFFNTDESAFYPADNEKSDESTFCGSAQRDSSTSAFSGMTTSGKVRSANESESLLSALINETESAESTLFIFGSKDSANTSRDEDVSLLPPEAVLPAQGGEAAESGLVHLKETGSMELADKVENKANVSDKDHAAPSMSAILETHRNKERRIYSFYDPVQVRNDMAALMDQFGKVSTKKQAKNKIAQLEQPQLLRMRKKPMQSHDSTDEDRNVTGSRPEEIREKQPQKQEISSFYNSHLGQADMEKPRKNIYSFYIPSQDLQEVTDGKLASTPCTSTDACGTEDLVDYQRATAPATEPQPCLSGAIMEPPINQNLNQIGDISSEGGETFNHTNLPDDPPYPSICPCGHSFNSSRHFPGQIQASDAISSFGGEIQFVSAFRKTSSHVWACPLSEPSPYMLKRSGSSYQLGPISDIVLLRGDKEGIPQDETEAALAQTYQELVTPLHSNRTAGFSKLHASTTTNIQEGICKDSTSQHFYSLTAFFLCTKKEEERAKVFGSISGNIATQEEDPTKKVDDLSGTDKDNRLGATPEPVVQWKEAQEANEVPTSQNNESEDILEQETPQFRDQDSTVTAHGAQNNARDVLADKTLIRFSSFHPCHTVIAESRTEEAVQPTPAETGGTLDPELKYMPTMSSEVIKLETRDTKAIRCPGNEPLSPSDNRELATQEQIPIKMHDELSNDKCTIIPLMDQTADNHGSCPSEEENSRKSKGSYGSARSSQEISASVEQVLSTLFPDGNFDDLAESDKTENLDIARTSEELISSAGHILLALFDPSSKDEDEENDYVSDGSSDHSETESISTAATLESNELSTVAEKTIILATPKVKRNAIDRPVKAVSESVEHVLSGLLATPSSTDESGTSTFSSKMTNHSNFDESHFLKEVATMTNTFLELFDLSSSTSDDKSDHDESTSQVREDLDEDDATLNSLETIDLSKISSRDSAEFLPSYVSGPISRLLETERGTFLKKNFPEQKHSVSRIKEDMYVHSHSCAAVAPYVPSQAVTWHVSPRIPRPNKLAFFWRSEIAKTGHEVLNLADILPLLDSLVASCSQPTALSATKKRSEFNPIQSYVSRKNNCESLSLFCRKDHLEMVPSSICIGGLNNLEDTVPAKTETNHAANQNDEKSNWSFSDLEASIEASLDSFMQDLLSPNQSSDSESSNTVSDEEAALEQLLSSENCEDIVENMRKQNDHLQCSGLHLDLTPTSADDDDRDDYSSGFSSVGSSRNLKAAALLSDGDSTLPMDDDFEDSLMDEPLYSPRGNERMDFIDGMALGIAGFLCEEDISRLQYPRAALPELFSTGHFGSVHDMVEEVHIMKAIQLERRLEQDIVDASDDVSSCDSVDLLERDEYREIFDNQENVSSEHCNKLEMQRSKIAALKAELEDEIESISIDICRMKLEMESQARSVDSKGYKFGPNTASDSNKKEVYASPSLKRHEGLETEIEDFDHTAVAKIGESRDHESLENLEFGFLAKYEGKTSHHERHGISDAQLRELTQCSDGAADSDGLEDEESVLNAVQEELRQQLRDAEELVMSSLSRSGSISATQPIGTTTAAIIAKDRSSDSLPNNKWDALGSLCGGGDFSSKQDDTGTSWSLPSSAVTRSRKVTFSNFTEEIFYMERSFMEDDALSSKSSKEESCSSSSAAGLCDLDDMQALFHDTVADLSIAFGWKQRQYSASFGRQDQLSKEDTRCPEVSQQRATTDNGRTIVSV